MPIKPLASFAFICSQPGCAFGRKITLDTGMSIEAARGGWGIGVSAAIRELVDHVVAHVDDGGCHEVRMVVHQSGEECDHER